jgi:NAD-dependent deacetylase
MSHENPAELIDRAADLIVQARNILVFTGAGISTESGIPDFRSPGGLWNRYDASQMTYGNFLASAENRKMHWEILTGGGLGGEAQPNPAHYAITELDRLGKLDCVVTQNIDYLHQKAGVPESKVFELHGSVRWAYCLNCGQRYEMQIVKLRLAAGDSDPRCESCRGILKPDVVMFGEAMPEVILEESNYRAAACDLCLVVGSSLVVYPAALVPYRAVQSRAG